jgi:hypothetical protein
MRRIEPLLGLGPARGLLDLLALQEEGKGATGDSRHLAMVFAGITLAREDTKPISASGSAGAGNLA